MIVVTQTTATILMAVFVSSCHAAFAFSQLSTLPSSSSSCPSSLFPSRTMSTCHSLQLQTQTHPLTLTTLSARRNRRPNDYDEDYDEDYYYDDEEEDDYPQPQRRRRRRRQIDIDNLGTQNDPSLPSPFGLTSGLRLPPSLSKALLAGVFMLGIGTGVTVDSQINTSPKDLASRDAVDQAAPNPRLCTNYGASAMAFDQRVFVSFNPFNVYVAQADVKPACVLRPSNVVPVLQTRGLINDGEVRSCKANMNTWAFVGDLDDLPQLSCVYKSDDAQNEFLGGNPKLGIGEDVYDDDREAVLAKVIKGKKVKDGLTQGQRVAAAKKAAALKVNSEFVNSLVEDLPEVEN